MQLDVEGEPTEMPPFPAENVGLASNAHVPLIDPHDKTIITSCEFWCSTVEAS